MKDKLNYAVLKCITHLPLSLEEVKLIMSRGSTEIMEEAEIDSYLLDKVRLWAKHESRRLMTVYGSADDYEMNVNPYPKVGKRAGR